MNKVAQLRKLDRLRQLSAEGGCSVDGTADIALANEFSNLALEVLPALLDAAETLNELWYTERLRRVYRTTRDPESPYMMTVWQDAEDVINKLYGE